MIHLTQYCPAVSKRLYDKLTLPAANLSLFHCYDLNILKIRCENRAKSKPF